MGEERIRYRRRSTESQNSVDTDTLLKIQLKGERRLLPNNDINRPVSLTDIFSKERNRSDRYRLIINIKPIISNPLFNVNISVDGGYYHPHGWMVFNETRFRKDPLSQHIDQNTNQPIDQLDVVVYHPEYTFDESYKEFLKERDGWFGYYDPSLITTGGCEYHYMEPKPRRFSFVRDVENKDALNWDLTVTYPYSADTTHYLINGGIKITNLSLGNVGSRLLVSVESPVRHNLIQGGSVMLSNMTDPQFNRRFRVLRVGDDNGNRKDNLFSINLLFSELTPTLSADIANARFRKVINGIPSDYGIRLFRKVKTISSQQIGNFDHEVYPLAFSNTIFREKIVQFINSSDIDVSDLRDNHNRPVSELFFTVIKKNSVQSKQFEGFTPACSALDLRPHQPNSGVPDIRRVAPEDLNNSMSTLETNITIGQNVFYGDVEEYNRFEQISHVLSEVAHRFNTEDRIKTNTFTITGFTGAQESRDLGPRYEGYFYYPHHSIKIRNFSSYLEQGDINVFGMPDYAIDIGDGRFIWRDLLDFGVNNGMDDYVDHPFLNGCHYVHMNICFPVRRQDPYGNYGLLFNSGNPLANRPYDPTGIGLPNNFDTNTAEDVC